jgi:hypothetical protein
MVDNAVQYQNLAGVPAYKPDGNLVPEATASGPRIMVIGTAGKGRGSIPYFVTSTATAKGEFGTDGTLLRGMYEAKAAGAIEIAMYRIGATYAIVTGIGNNGGTGGWTVQTISEDADAGGDYALYYDDSADRLVVKRNSDDLIVFDNDLTTPLDRGEVVVSGYRASVGGVDIGSPSSYVNLEDIDSSTYAGTSYTAGTDGLDLSRMEIYEALYKAYEHLKETDFDVLIPMDVYLDDKNVVAQGHYDGAVTPEGNGTNVYPTGGYNQPGTDVDSLGMVYSEQYEGDYYFWWRFDTSSATADVWPAGIGSASASAKIDGTALTADDFHEVNFGYQLGRYLYEYSTNIVDATGVIGVLPPASNSLVDRSRWAGEAPTWTLNNSTNLYYIASAADDGTGLLGNKFMAGKYSHPARPGLFGGGFIATEDQWMDSGTTLLDANDVAVDLGKYFSVVVDYPLLRNNYNSVAYLASMAASYGGFYINMPANSAPTNKTVSNMLRVYKLGLTILDNLAGAGYVVLREKRTGIKIADAPTAALASSDWTRLSTCRIAKVVIDGVREAADPYLGEGLSQASKAAMHTAVENVLIAAKKAQYLKDFREFEIIQTPQMEVAGTATIDLTLVPAFELRQVVVSVSLSKSS